MKFFSRENFRFLKSNFQIVYAILLMILIPAALVANTLVFVDRFQKVMDTELLRKASLASSIFSTQVVGSLTDQPALQTLVNNTAGQNDEIYSLDVLVPDGDHFKIIASLEAQAVGTVSTYIYNSLAWDTGEAKAYVTTSKSLSTENQQVRSDQRFWVIVNPVKDSTGQKKAIVSMKVSSQVIDELVRQNLARSLVILVLTIVVVLLLLINNTKLFRYAVLFRKLKEVDQMKDEFISMAAHELRAPIVGIRGYLQMIVDGSFGQLPDTAGEKVRLVFGETNRLHDLVEDLLEVSRIQQGRVKLDMQPLPIKPLIQGVIDTFEQQARQKGLQLIVEFQPDVPQVYADASRLQQILVNLTSNALKYTPKGKVTVSAELAKGKEEQVKIKVSDTGLGMSAKDREHLFEKFYRVRNEKTDKISGTGLGLWITRELVRLMKGEIYVDSIENVGTQVTILLPVFKEDK